MADVVKKSFWKEKSTGQIIQVLDVGVWIMNVDTKERKTVDIARFDERYERVANAQTR